MPELARFQDAFSEALAGDVNALTPWILGADAIDRLDVYRNTVRKGLIDAVLAAYPTVERVVGSEWLSAAANLFVQDHPPACASLALYGEGFADWLDAFEPAASMPYLPTLACLDRFWLESHLAADAPIIGADALADRDAERLARLGLTLHPSARIAWFDENLPSLWLANRPEAEASGEFELRREPQGVLIVRPEGAVCIRLLDRATYVFAAACAEGASLTAAAEQVLLEEPAADLAAVVSTCLAGGLFTALQAVGSAQGEAS